AREPGPAREVAVRPARPIRPTRPTRPTEMQIGALGDIHGEFDTVQSIMRRHGEVPLWVCVGDVASNDGEYFTPEQALYFIKGNNEDFDLIAGAAKGELAPTLHYL